VKRIETKPSSLTVRNDYSVAQLGTQVDDDALTAERREPVSAPPSDIMD
jgi:hypothetical protein